MQRNFESRVMRRIFGPKRDEVTGELNDMYSSLKIFRVMNSRTLGWDGCVARTGRPEVCTVFWWGKLRKETIWKKSLRWEDDIKMDLQEVGCEGMDWIGLAQYRDGWWAIVNAVMNFRIP